MTTSTSAVGLKNSFTIRAFIPSINNFLWDPSLSLEDNYIEYIAREVMLNKLKIRILPKEIRVKINKLIWTWNHNISPYYNYASANLIKLQNNVSNCSYEDQLLYKLYIKKINGDNYKTCLDDILFMREIVKRNIKDIIILYDLHFKFDVSLINIQENLIEKHKFKSPVAQFRKNIHWKLNINRVHSHIKIEKRKCVAIREYLEGLPCCKNPIILFWNKIDTTNIAVDE